MGPLPGVSSQQAGASALPLALTSFVGHQRELHDVAEALSTSRLVTLTGVGGVGKSRLALRVAELVRHRFAAGAWLIEFSPLGDPSLVAAEVAARLGSSDLRDRNPEAALGSYLADKQMLLVLDNCEHLAAACARLVTSLLEVAPDLRILVASRKPFGVEDEQVIPVPPLPVGSASEPRALRSDALGLFEERVSAIMPGFRLDRDNRSTVANLCQRLDGLPLAIELAAVRMRTLSARQILERLDTSSDILSARQPRRIPRHHETMRSAMDWSYRLCTPQERMLWRRLAVFIGGFDQQAVEAVCADGLLRREDIGNALDGLAQQSVLIRTEGQQRARYCLLETIRDYGRCRLGAEDCEESLRRRHRDYYLQLAERAAMRWRGDEEVSWLELLRAEQGNIRAALDFCLAANGEAREGLRLAGALWCLWIGGGFLFEGARWLDTLLALEHEPSPEVAQALWVRGWIAQEQGDHRQMSFLDRSRRVARSVGDGKALACATELSGASLSLRGHARRATELLEEAVELHRAVGQQAPLAQLTFAFLGFAYCGMGDTERGIALLEVNRAHCETQGERWGLAMTQEMLGHSRWAIGDTAGVRELHEQALRTIRPLGNQLLVAMAIEELAWFLGAQGQPRRAARLLGATHSIWPKVGRPLLAAQFFVDAHRQCEERTREALGDPTFEAIFEEGASLRLDAAVREALGESGHRGPESTLTRREWEIAWLVAQGMSTKDIARRLTIALRTVDSHVEHIFGKLGINTRAQLTAWVVEQEH